MKFPILCPNIIIFDFIISFLMDNIELSILLYHTLICLSLKIYLFNKIGHEIIFYKIKSILITGNKSSNLKTKSSRRLIIS